MNAIPVVPVAEDGFSALDSGESQAGKPDLREPLLILPRVPGLEVMRPANLLRLSQAERKPGGWLWPQRIAAGKVTVIVGENGLGKSSIAADLAARVSQGRPWPGEEGGNAPLGAALVVCAAEEQFDLLPARLEGAGADFDNICMIEAELFDDGVVGHPAQRPRSIVERLALVHAALESLPDCKLVVIDPLSVYLDGPDGRRSGAVQFVMQGLAKLARKFGVAIVVVAHLSGMASLRAFSQFVTTLGPPSAGRSVWGVVRDPEDADRQLVVSLDGNFAKPHEALSFRLATGDGTPMPHVEWGTTAPTSLRDVISASSGFRISERKYYDTENYVDIRLREVLAAGPIGRTEINREIKASEEQLYRGAKRLGIVMQKKGYYDGWVWMLPEHFLKWQADQEQNRQELELERERRKNAKRKWKRAERRAAREMAARAAKAFGRPQEAAPNSERFEPEEQFTPFVPWAEEHRSTRAEEVADVGAACRAAPEPPNDSPFQVPPGRQDLPDCNPTESVPQNGDWPPNDLPPVEHVASKPMTVEPMTAEAREWNRNFHEKLRRREAEWAAKDEAARRNELNTIAPDEDESNEEVSAEEEERLCWVEDWCEEDFKGRNESVRDGPG